MLDLTTCDAVFLSFDEPNADAHYDRVLEDRVLVAADAAGTRRFRASIPNAIRFAFRQLAHRLRGRLHRFGHAAVAYGAPLSLHGFARAHPDDTTEALGQALETRLSEAIPVVTVPLIALELEGIETPLPEAQLVHRMKLRLAALKGSGAPIHMPKDDLAKAVSQSLNRLRLRRLIADEGDGVRIAEGRERLMAFYANSIRHLVDRASAPPPTDQP